MYISDIYICIIYIHFSLLHTQVHIQSQTAHSITILLELEIRESCNLKSQMETAVSILFKNTHYIL